MALLLHQDHFLNCLGFRWSAIFQAQIQKFPVQEAALRAIDLSKLKSYADLISDLERLFGMEGLLQDPAKGWRILYTDKENEVIVVGDDPWNEFCDVVSKIHIHTREEVQRMTVGIVTDDNRSCCEGITRFARWIQVFTCGST